MKQPTTLGGATSTNDMRSDNIGSLVELDGSRPDMTGRLVTVDDDSVTNVPWLLSASTRINSGTNVANAIIGPVIKGKFGSGSVMHDFECDASPDSIITMPGSTAVADVGWDSLIVCVGTGALDTISRVRSFGGNNLLPDSAKIRGSVKHGSPVNPNATRTFVILPTGAAAHDIRLTLPAFSDEFMIYTPDPNYAQISFVGFLSNGGVGGLYQLTGAQIQTVKNAGGKFPIPGDATTIEIVTTNAVAGTIQLCFFLNL